LPISVDICPIFMSWAGFWLSISVDICPIFMAWAGFWLLISVDMIHIHVVRWILGTYFSWYDQYACRELDCGHLFLLLWSICLSWAGFWLPISVDMTHIHVVSWVLVTYVCWYDPYSCRELDSGCLFVLIWSIFMSWAGFWLPISVEVIYIHVVSWILWWNSERFVVLTKQLQAAKCSLSCQICRHFFIL
jgi:hypothetical protein